MLNLDVESYNAIRVCPVGRQRVQHLYLTGSITLRKPWMAEDFPEEAHQELIYSYLSIVY